MTGRPLTNKEGQPTSVVYVVTRMVRKLLEEQQPDRVAVIFDAKGKTFRHKLYSEYKANRRPCQMICKFKSSHFIH